MKLPQVVVAAAAFSLATFAFAQQQQPQEPAAQQEQHAQQKEQNAQQNEQQAQQKEQSAQQKEQNAQNEQEQSASSGATSQSPDVVKQVQQSLKDQGMNPGPIDGKMGPKTEAAVKQYQEKEGLQANGQLDQDTLTKLGVSESGAASTGATSGSKNMNKPHSKY